MCAPCATTDAKYAVDDIKAEQRREAEAERLREAQVEEQRQIAGKVATFRTQWGDECADALKVTLDAVAAAEQSQRAIGFQSWMQNFLGIIGCLGPF